MAWMAAGLAAWILVATWGIGSLGCRLTVKEVSRLVGWNNYGWAGGRHRMVEVGCSERP